MKMVLSIASLLILVLASGCVQMPGGDRDGHGCIPSAGYSWCEEKQKCLREWEEPCKGQMTGNDSDAHGCKASAGYSWCESRQECVREWETPCQMSLGEALGIAQSSQCAQEGAVSEDGAVFNNNSMTWWLTLEADKPGCSPACVVYENRTAEVNWRCTGLIPEQMTEEEARAIAETSDCMKEGNLTDEAYYNNATRTWWVGTDIQKAGCSPMCVVSEDARTAEINWMCTGLLPEVPESCAKQGTQYSMTLEDAKAVSLNSVCTMSGPLTDNATCNEVTGTWWIDVDVYKPGCHPACVVNVETRLPEMNWRCTGLNPGE